MKALRLVFVLAITLSYVQNGYCQPIDIRQIRIAGGNINFIVNSYNKYENGITYPITTRLSITYRVDGVIGWELYAWADQIEFLSDIGETFPLEILELKFTSFSASDGGLLNEDFELHPEASKDLLASGSGGDPDQVDIELIIEYSIGKSSDPLLKLMNRVEGFYYLNLHFELVKIE